MSVTVRFAGYGGQGIIKTSVLVGLAAMMQGKHSLQNQTYGPQSRGGLSKGDVIISDNQINEVEPDEVDIFCALSQLAYDKYADTLRGNGMLITDSGLVTVPENAKQTRSYSLPATELATGRFGSRLITGTLVIGFLIAKADMVDADILKKTVAENVPKDSINANIDAFEMGRNLGAGLGGSVKKGKIR